MKCSIFLHIPVESTILDIMTFHASYIVKVEEKFLSLQATKLRQSLKVARNNYRKQSRVSRRAVSGALAPPRGGEE